jgi:hypothetical protein
MRKVEQEQLMVLLNKFCGQNDLYELIDLLYLMYRSTDIKTKMEFGDFMRVQLADNEQK